MPKYKNTTPFPLVLESKSGPRFIKPNEEFESIEVLNVPGIQELSKVKDEDLFRTKEDPKPIPEVAGTPINLLLSQFQSRFGTK